MGRVFQIELEFRSVGIRGGKTRETGEKPTEQPGKTLGTLATLVEGERSHHCAILLSQIEIGFQMRANRRTKITILFIYF